MEGYIVAVLSFWSGSKKETGQTLSIVAIATYMSVEHNYKTLVIDATLDDDTIERCFWRTDSNKDIKRELNKGKLDIASGTEGLMSAIASNKTTPEIISNYTRVVFKDRLDILMGLKTRNMSEHEKTLQLYPELINAANKFYDLVIIDLSKTFDRASTQKILQMSDVIMYTMSQNLKQIDEYVENRKKIKEISRKNVIPLIGSTNNYCKYNPKNVATYVKDKELAYITYNNGFLEAASEAKVANFFLSTKISQKANDRNSEFLQSVANSAQKVIDRFEKIKYGKTSRS